MSKHEELLRVSNLTVEFSLAGGRMRVLNDINLTVNKGETLCLVGESGCGKSMTALAIMQLLPQPVASVAGGQVVLNGTDLLTLSAREMRHRRGTELAMIFQEPMTALNPAFTIGNQITETIRQHDKVSRAEARSRAIEMLRAVGIPAPDRRIDEYPHQLSGGMRQRAMIAIALSCNPDLIIADEPTTALDVTVQAQIFDLLRKLQADLGIGLILITHDIGSVAEMADRVAVMYAGRKVEEGPVAEIIYNAHHPYTRALLKSVPTIREEAGGFEDELPEIPGIVPALDALPKGCPFAPRCAHVMDVCKQFPRMTNVADEHSVACWLHIEGEHLRDAECESTAEVTP